MKKTFLLLAATCCLVMNQTMANTITYKASSKLTLEATSFTPNFTSHTFSSGTGTITFSGNVTVIGKEAFENQNNLTSITLPNTITEIGNYAFSNCEGLKAITIPNSVTTIGEYAFDQNQNLSSVTIGSGVKTIGQMAFSSCTDLLTLEVPKTVTNIGSNAFYKILNIHYEGTATYGSHRQYWGAKYQNGFVSDSMVYESSKRKVLYACHIKKTGQVKPASSTTTIHSEAFYDCANITSVVIPYHVTKIENYAFGKSTKLTSIYCESAYPPVCSNGTFDVYTQTVYVPKDYISAYKDAYKWKEFKDNIVADTRTRNFGISIYGTPVSTTNCEDVLKDGGSVVYEDPIHTLYLNNATLSSANDVVTLYDDITIRCGEGSNSITCTGSDYAIYGDGGRINIISGKLNISSQNGTAMVAAEGLFIGKVAQVTIQSPNATALACDSLLVDDSELIVKGNKKNATISCNYFEGTYYSKIRSDHYYNGTTHKFISNKTGLEAKDDIVISYQSQPSDIEEVTGDRLQVTGSRKVMRNGQLLILRDGKTYNALGQEL